jgi:hydrogenase nickel incorporation protein HypA/HybF
MHELSIAEAVVGVVTRHAGGRCVTKVEVKVGHLRQVAPPALELAFELVTGGTPLETAELALEEVPATGRCACCAAETVLEGFPLLCGSCGSPDLELLTGEELLVDAIELEEPRPQTSRG